MLKSPRKSLTINLEKPAILKSLATQEIPLTSNTKSPLGWELFCVQNHTSDGEDTE